MSNWEEIGKVWVDSGQLIMVDPCKVLSNGDYDLVSTLRHPVHFKKGIVSSGWGGDGNFPVYTKKNDKGLVLEMKIVFNEDDTSISDIIYDINLENHRLEAQKKQLELQESIHYLNARRRDREEHN